ncbi:MAG: hypothetical protein M3N18_09905 [Actinomycetota bacterium]|nr:hypothetical protein [Actinomycetota bacterium]
MSLLSTWLLGLLVATVGMAALSAWVVTTSINEGDAGSAWIWVVLFLVTSVVAALSFRGLV